MFAYISLNSIIPFLTNKNKFFIFYNWSMFSDSHIKNPVDIIWKSPNGKINYLLRDHKWGARRAGINTYMLSYFIRDQNLSNLKNSFYEQIKQYCKCEKIEVVSFSGTLFEYFISKKNLPVKERTAL